MSNYQTTSKKEMQEIKELNKLLSKYVDDGFFPGIQWQINIDNDQYFGKYGFNNIGTQEKVLDNSLYRIWSMTKPIISVVILQLIQENKIKLDDPIKKYLPVFENLKVLKENSNSISDTQDIKNHPTIKDLLLHTAGFSYNFLNDPVGEEYHNVGLFNSDHSTLEDEINLLATLPLLYEPNTRWLYSVTVDVLARIIEVVCNSNLQDELKERIYNAQCIGNVEPIEYMVPYPNLRALIDGQNIKYGQKMVYAQKSLTSDKLYRMAQQTANWLQSNGAAPKDRVMLETLSFPESEIAALGIWTLGCSLVFSGDEDFKSASDATKPVFTISKETNLLKEISNFAEKFEPSVKSLLKDCLLYTSPSPRDRTRSRMPSSA